MIPNLPFGSEHAFETTIKQLQAKYPRRYRQLFSLENDAEFLRKKTEKKFLFLLVPTWSLIFYRQASGNPLLFFRQYGRILKTHRVLRLYAYSFAAIYTYCWVPYHSALKATTQKLIDTDLIRNSPNFVDFDVKMPQQLDISSTILPHKKIV